MTTHPPVPRPRRQRYREGQEDQLGALGLVVNVIVLWNTLYMDAVLQQLYTEESPVHPTDVARPSLGASSYQFPPASAGDRKSVV